MNIVKTYSLTLSSLLKKHLLILGVVLFIPIQNNAQQSVKDSLKEQLHIKRSQPGFTTKDTLYIDLINALGNEMRFYNSDSLLKLSKQALDLSKSTDYKFGENKALLGLGDYYSDKGSNNKGITCL